MLPPLGSQLGKILRGSLLDRVIELTNETAEWDPQEEAMVGPGGLLVDSGAMDATHRIMATSHSSKENDLPEPLFEFALAGNVPPMSTKERLYGGGSPECMKIPKLHLQATGDMNHMAAV